MCLYIEEAQSTKKKIEDRETEGERERDRE